MYRNQTIRLNEGQLKRVVAEAVKRVLKEEQNPIYGKEDGNKGTKQIWIRLGGYFECPNERIDDILNGNSDTLLRVISDNGFVLDGDSYIPSEDGDVSVEFDIHPPYRIC